MAWDKGSDGPVILQGLPLPGGHYSHAVRGGGLIFVSGQLPVSGLGEHPFEVTFEEQALQVLCRVKQIVEQSGSAQEKILKVTAFIVGVENWPRFNAVYGDMFGEHRPARSVVPVAALHHGWLVEVEAIAVA
jgi:2-iminobutanoate/2-iminopropanoate deaminase